MIYNNMSVALRKFNSDEQVESGAKFQGFEGDF